MAVLVLIALVSYSAYAIWERRKTDRLLADGERVLAAREYTQARELFERYLEERPGDTRARILAARSARQSKSFRDAREHLKRCRTDGGDSEAIDLEETLIRVQTGDEQPVAALRERATQDDDLALVALEVLVQHDLDTYQLGLALDGFTRYLARRPDDLHALLGRGFIWERFLNFSDAVEDYRRAVAAHPESDRARLKLAENLLVAGAPDDALVHFEWLSARGPERPPVRLGLARTYRKLGRAEEAIKLLDVLLAEFPTNGETLWERGELELEQGKPEAAERLLRKAVAQMPHDRRVHYALGRCLLRLEKFDDAQVHSERVKQLDADTARLSAIRSEVMRRPDDVGLRCEGGIIFLRNGERDEGIRWLQLALRLDPGSATARAALAAEGLIPK